LRKVIEFTNDRLERLKALVAEEYGFQHHHHRLIFTVSAGSASSRTAVVPSPHPLPSPTRGSAVFDPMHFVPTKGFLTRGVGRHKES